VAKRVNENVNWNIERIINTKSIEKYVEIKLAIAWDDTDELRCKSNWEFRG